MSNYFGWDAALRVSVDRLEAEAVAVFSWIPTNRRIDIPISLGRSRAAEISRVVAATAVANPCGHCVIEERIPTIVGIPKQKNEGNEGRRLRLCSLCAIERNLSNSSCNYSFGFFHSTLDRLSRQGPKPDTGNSG